MDVYIECPVCEERFYAPDGPSTTRIVCPSCSRKFELTSIVKIQSPPEKAELRPASPALSSRLARQATFEKPGAASSQSPDELSELPALESSDDNAIPFSKPKLPGTTEIRNRYQRRNKRKLIVTLVTGGILAAVIGVLSGLLVMQLQKQSLAKNDPDNSEAKTGDPGADTPSSNQPPERDAENGESTRANRNNRRSAPANNDAAISKTDQPIRLTELPPQELEFLSRKNIEQCWEIVQPHLVSLRVTDSRGTHNATGTIVDSRGWILTSYSAVVGASQIEVTSSAKSIDELPDENLLSDLVRGVVAADPDHDLVLLSINRRFVISFADIEVAASNKIVEGEYLVQCAPPSKDNPYARTEAKILIRDNLAALDPEGQSLARAKNLGSPDLTWLVATNDTSPLPGTPLVRPDGTVAAINVFAGKGSGYFLPVDNVNTLLATASDEIESLAVLGGSTLDEGPVVSIGMTHPMRDVSERLNQLGDSCRQFGWIAQTDAQYTDLQNFAEQVTLALTYVMENADSGEEEVEQIATLVKQYENTLTKRMAAMNSDDLLNLRKMNKFAKEELKKPSRYVPFYGKVYLGGIDLVDKLILRFDVDQTFVNIPFEPSDDDPMLPDSQWLFFIKTPAAVRTVNFSVAGEQSIPTFSADLQFAIGPTN